VLTGLLGAFAAAVLYGAATVLQAAGVRRLRAVPASASLPARWWAGRLYAVGLGVDVVGFLASIAALRTLPLFVVQSAIASSVAVTALLAVLFLGARLERREVVALVVVGLGLLALALSATEEPAVRVGPGARWVLLTGVVPVAALAVAGLAHRGPRSAVLLALASGLGFGGVGVASRLLVVPDPWLLLVASPTAWAILAYAAVALVCFGMALDRGSVTTTAAVTFAVETVVPSAIGLLLLHDRVRAGYPVVAALGFAATLGGCIALARRAEPPSETEGAGVGPGDAASGDLRPSG
jgi:drug/metabolite transporter (DMT)-like permease